MDKLTITLYTSSKDSKSKMDRRIRDVRETVAKHVSIDVDITIVKWEKPESIKWINAGYRANDRDGSRAFYADPDPVWFQKQFPNVNKSDVVAVYFTRQQWYELRQEFEFMQVGISNFGVTAYPTLAFTDPGNSDYTIGPSERVSKWAWIIVHELSHVFYRQLMQAYYDPTHDYDYGRSNLVAAIIGWSLQRRNAMQKALAAAQQYVDAKTSPDTKVPEVPSHPDPLPVTTPPATMAKLDLFCAAIREHEGWYVGSRSYRNNNPGNFRCGSIMNALASGKDKDGFCVFPSAAVGMQALQKMVRNAAIGKSSVYKPTDTIYQFFNKYAPAADANNPKHYAEFVAGKVGISPTAQISTLV